MSVGEEIQCGKQRQKEILFNLSKNLGLLKKIKQSARRNAFYYRSVKKITANLLS